MPVAASAIGTVLPSRVTDVTARMTLAYAAAVGETGTRTFDDAGANPVVAPPAFCVVLEWPVVSAPLRREALGISQDEARRSVHVEQDSTFHRVVRPGDRLVTAGRIVAVRQTRAGALVHTHLHTSDAATGLPVVTSWHASLFRGVEVSGSGSAVLAPPRQHDTMPAPTHDVTIRIDRALAHVYTECTGIWNPIHTERRAALAAGLPDIILHGTTTWALAGREIVRRLGGNDPERLGRLRAWFGAPVIPGTSITMHLADVVDGRVSFAVSAADGRPAIADGVAELRPDRQETI